MSDYAKALARPPRTLTAREITLLLGVTGKHADGFRDHVLFSLAIGTGLREHEIVALNLGDVFDDAGGARRHVALRVFKRSASNPAVQEVVLSETLRAKLNKLRKQKMAAGHDLGPDAPVFISLKGGRLSRRMVRHAFGLWQTRAGFERHFGFHALRHTACTDIYRRTKDIRLTQRFARHTSILSTQIYAHPAEDELLRAVQGLPG